MNVQDWTVVITTVTASVMTGFTAYSVWSDRRKKAEWEQARLKREDERNEAEANHRRKMEELAMISIRQGGQAAKEAKKAQQAAIQGRQEVTSKIEASQIERRDQMAEVISINKEALEAANGVNAKIQSLGEDISARQQLSEQTPVPVTVTNFPPESHEK